MKDIKNKTQANAEIDRLKRKIRRLEKEWFVPDTKVCSICNEEKDTSEYTSKCKKCLSCRKKYNKEFYQKNKDKYWGKK